MGHELSRHLAERAAVMPPKAAAPSRDQGGRGAPLATKVQRNKPTSYLMTSSKAAKERECIVNPSAFAVLRLITSRNSVGCSIGRPAGFARH